VIGRALSPLNEKCQGGRDNTLYILLYIYIIYTVISVLPPPGTPNLKDLGAYISNNLIPLPAIAILKDLAKLCFLETEGANGDGRYVYVLTTEENFL
jgi:hypothetical protein